MAVKNAAEKNWLTFLDDFRTARLTVEYQILANLINEINQASG